MTLILCFEICLLLLGTFDAFRLFEELVKGQGLIELRLDRLDLSSTSFFSEIGMQSKLLLSFFLAVIRVGLSTRCSRLLSGVFSFESTVNIVTYGVSDCCDSGDANQFCLFSFIADIGGTSDRSESASKMKLTTYFKSAE